MTSQSMRGRRNPLLPPNRRVQRVVFVCRGNICRSPVAAALYPGESHDRVISRALEHWNIGRKADPTMATVAASYGVHLDAHRASVLSPQDVGWADALVCMEVEHIRLLRELFGDDAGDRAILLDPSGIDILDPYKKGSAAAGYVFRQISDALIGLPQRILDLSLRS